LRIVYHFLPLPLTHNKLNTNLKYSLLNQKADSLIINFVIVEYALNLACQ